jgi:RNA 2',3'-cyclic 3'-phosphodiesterase
MRLFVALDIDDGIWDRVARFLEAIRDSAPAARWVHPESLHVTLKFIGEKSKEEAKDIAQALKTITSDGFEMNFRGYGFFPNTQAARVFWIATDGGPSLHLLAAKVDDTLTEFNVSKQEESFNPHLTLARRGGGSGSPRKEKGDRPNRGFEQLQERLAAMPVPEFGKMMAHEFCLYQSQLSPGGSKYTKLARFALH